MPGLKWNAKTGSVSTATLLDVTFRVSTRKKLLVNAPSRKKRGWITKAPALKPNCGVIDCNPTPAPT